MKNVSIYGIEIEKKELIILRKLCRGKVFIESKGGKSFIVKGIVDFFCCRGI